jgi:hypothetical protein
MTMPYDDGLGVATQVSYPGGSSVNGVATLSAAPGATGPGASQSPSTAIVYIIGGAALALIALAIIFRKPIGDG